jgi:anthranilate phosphoribosyltransferase
MAASTTISLIAQLEAGRLLSRAEAEALMEELLCGRMETTEIVRFLLALNQRPILVSELAGFAMVMRRHAERVFKDGETCPECLVDTCGTGGDGFGSFNISTAAASGEAWQSRGQFTQRIS